MGWSFCRAKTISKNSSFYSIWCWTSNIGCVWWPFSNNTMVHRASLRVRNKYEYTIIAILPVNLPQMVQNRKIAGKTMELGFSPTSMLAPTTSITCDSQSIQRRPKSVWREDKVQYGARKHWTLFGVHSFSHDNDCHLGTCNTKWSKGRLWL